MNIIQFLDEAGGSRLSFQMLHECVQGATKRRGFTEVRFGTTHLDPIDLIGAPRQVGVIVWIPKDDYDRARGAARSDSKEPA